MPSRRRSRPRGRRCPPRTRSRRRRRGPTRSRRTSFTRPSLPVTGCEHLGLGTDERGDAGADLRRRAQVPARDRAHEEDRARATRSRRRRPGAAAGASERGERGGSGGAAREHAEHQARRQDLGDDEHPGRDQPPHPRVHTVDRMSCGRSARRGGSARAQPQRAGRRVSGPGPPSAVAALHRQREAEGRRRAGRAVSTSSISPCATTAPARSSSAWVKPTGISST